MSRGFSMPLILIVILLLILIPTGYVLYSVRNGDSAVKGSEDINITPDNGLKLGIKSSRGSWEVVEILCKEQDECLSSLDSGKYWSSVGGGASDFQDVVITNDSRWGSYKYLKIYVKRGLGGSEYFKMISSGGLAQDHAKEFTVGNQIVNSVIVPIEEFNDSFIAGPLFEE